MITIDLRRDGGRVTRLQGPAGLAIVLQGDVPSVEHIPDTEDAARAWKNAIEWPVLSLRLKQPEELVVMCAVLMAATKQHGDELLLAATLLAPYVRVGNPLPGGGG